MEHIWNPADIGELSQVVTEAYHGRTAIDVAGGATKSGVGRPISVNARLSTSSLRGITTYEPTELFMSARAGTPVSEIESVLAQRHQMLAFEPVDLAPLLGKQAGHLTIGGVFATNLSGARRITAGACRDHLLGMRGVNGKGEVFRAGGRVMKNVTGVDICRGVAGSWGTLAIMEEVTFKVLPAPEDSRSLVFTGLDDEIATELMCQAMGTPYEVNGTVHLQASLAGRLKSEAIRQSGKSVTVLRLENFSRFLPYRIERLRSALKSYGDPEILDNETSLDFWHEMRFVSVFVNADSPIWRISTSPSESARLAATIQKYIDCHVMYDWSGGLVWIEVEPALDAGAADIRRAVAAHGGHALLVRATPEIRMAVDVFEPLERPAEILSLRIKQSFDPAGILNPGRMYATM